MALHGGTSTAGTQGDLGILADACIPIPSTAKFPSAPLHPSKVPSQWDLCGVCHGAKAPGWEMCRSCEVVKAQLPFFSPTVLPISLTTLTSPLYLALVAYKSSAVPLSVRVHASAELSILLGGFLARHWSCLVNSSRPTPSGQGPCDQSGPSQKTWGDLCLVTVPRSRQGPIASRFGPSARPPLAHPLEHVVATACSRLAREQGGSPRVCRLLGRGTAPVGHRLASPDAYVATGDLSGVKAVVVEDTYVSGAHAQSAACALALAGAKVLGILTIGRMVNPSYSAQQSALWETATSIPFDASICCLEKEPRHPHGSDSAGAFRASASPTALAASSQ